MLGLGLLRFVRSFSSFFSVLSVFSEPLWSIRMGTDKRTPPATSDRRGRFVFDARRIAHALRRRSVSRVRPATAASVVGSGMTARPSAKSPPPIVPISVAAPVARSIE
jgi:hypothetical protein